MSNDTSIIDSFTQKEWLAMELRRYFSRLEYCPRIDELTTQELKEMLARFIEVTSEIKHGRKQPSSLAEEDSA